MKILKLLNVSYGDNRGAAFVITLMILFGLSSLGMSIMGLSDSNRRTTETDRDYQSVYYIAEGAMNYTTAKVKNEVESIYNNSSSSYVFFNNVESFFNEIEATDFDFFESSFGSATTAEIVIDGEYVEPYIRDYTITAKGMIGGIVRSVQSVIRIQWEEKSGFYIDPPELAVFAGSGMELNNGSIYGDIGTNSAINNSIQITGNPYINGQLAVLNGVNPEELILYPDYKELFGAGGWFTEGGTTMPLKQYPDMPPLIFPENLPKHEVVTVGGPWNAFDVIDEDGNLNMNSWQAADFELELNSNVYFPEMNFASNYQFFLDIGNKNRKILVDNLNLTNGHLRLIGTGTLSIYVTDSITFGSGSTINAFFGNNSSPFGADWYLNPANRPAVEEAMKRVNIYLKGSGNSGNPKDFTLAGSQKVVGSLYAEDANVTLTSGGSIFGHIFTGGSSVTVSGGSNNIAQIIYAPNANFTLSEGGTLYGSIVSNEINMYGGSQIHFEAFDDISYIPIITEAQEETAGWADVLYQSIQPIREQ